MNRASPALSGSGMVNAAGSSRDSAASANRTGVSEPDRVLGEIG